MSLLKISFFCALFFGVLWFLYPSPGQKYTSDGVIEIHFLGASGQLGAAMQEVTRIFEEQSVRAHASDPSKPVYRVIFSQNTSRDLTSDPTRFILSVAGGAPPDVVVFDRFAVAEWSYRGVFQPLDSYIQSDLSLGRAEPVRPEDYYPAAWNEVAEGSSGVFGVPIDIDTRALYYNEDLLLRAGYTDDQGKAKPPKTWEELEEMAVKLTEYDDSGHMARLGFSPNFGNSWLYLYAWMNGGELMSPDHVKVTMDSPRVVEALEWVTRVYDLLGGAKSVYGFQSSFQGGALDPFVLGRVAMKISTSSEISSTLAQYGGNLSYAVAPGPLPAKEIEAGTKNVTWMGGWCYAIPSSAKQKDAGWELVRFLSSDSTRKLIAEYQRLNMESQGRVYVPLQAAKRKINEEIFQEYVYDRPEIDPKIKAACRTFNSLIDYSRYRPVTPVGQLLWNQHVAATENAIFKRMSPREALTEANQTVQEQLDKILKPSQGMAVDWNGFLIAYTLLILFAVIGVCLWDGRKNGSAGGNAHRPYWMDGWIGAFPWIFGFIVFTAGPILFSFVISFCRYDAINPAIFVGLENYKRMFTGDPLFWKSVGNTLFMVIGMVLGNGLSLGLAILLNLKVRGIAVWRTFFYIPSIVPLVAASILWIWLLNPDAGLINGVLAAFDIHGPSWLQDPETSKASLIIMGLWASGGGIIIWLAGLKGISESYYEAAMLDGANSWQKFLHITLPMLSPCIFFNLVIGLIGTLQIFTQSFVMTQGGPANSTLFYVYHLFNNAFRYLDMGYAAAMAWGLFVVVLAVTLIQMKLSKRWVHYEGE